MREPVSSLLVTNDMTGVQLVERSAVQLPDFGIESISGITHQLPVSTEEIPWLSEDRQVSLRTITMVGGSSILYGSIVNGNHALEKIARMVIPERSKQAQAALFTSLPAWLEGHDMPAIDTVHCRASVFGLYKACRGRRDPARLFFARTNVGETPAVIKVAVARHKDQGRVAGILTTMACHGRVPRHYSG